MGNLRRHELLSMLIIVLLIALSVKGQDFTGDATAYGDDFQGGNCGFTSLSPYAQKYFAALNNEQFDRFSHCGQCAEVECTSPVCQGKPRVIVQFTNRCPECKHGDIDFSNTAFQELTGSSPSRLRISWRFVQCPSNIVSGNLEYYVKDGSNPYWFALQPRNSMVSVTKMEVQPQGRDWIELQPPGTNSIDSYYFLGQMSDGLRTPFSVRSTSANGGVIVDTFDSLNAGDTLHSQSQF